MDNREVMYCLQKSLTFEFKPLVKSFTYFKKNKGVRIERWDTPA